MKKCCYPLWYRLDNQSRYLIWYSIEDAAVDMDGFVLDENNKILSFGTLEDLAAYAERENLPMESESLDAQNLTLMRFDMVARWLNSRKTKPRRPVAIRCSEFLSVWNLFTDMSRSLGGNFDADRKRTNGVYDKLFWGSNLPVMTPEGESYTPRWSASEKRILREVIRHGLRMFRRNIKHQIPFIG